MALRRFYIPPKLICDKETKLPSTEARHVKKVLRVREGEPVEIIDGEGGIWSGVVEFRNGEVFVCALTPIKPHSQHAAARLTLAMATIKTARFEWAIEKATELGVDDFLPLYTARSVIRFPAEKISGRLTRWNRIVQESSKQCRRLNVPCVHPPVEFRDLLSSEEYQLQNRIFFHEKSDKRWRPDQTCFAGNTTICIGPEGGWAEDEVEFAEKSGCGVFNMGSLVLRAETAAIASLAAYLVMK